jgi:hypothetical protein
MVAPANGPDSRTRISAIAAVILTVTCRHCIS